MATPHPEDLGPLSLSLSMTPPWIPAERDLTTGLVLHDWGLHALAPGSNWFLLSLLLLQLTKGMRSALAGPEAPSGKVSGCAFTIAGAHKGVYLYSWGVRSFHPFCLLTHRHESPESI